MAGCWILRCGWWVPWLALSGREGKRSPPRLPHPRSPPARCNPPAIRSIALGARAPRVIYAAIVDRQPPRATSDEIALYIRTYYSLLRSSGDVRVRAFEEAHLFSRSSLHLGAEAPEPDLAAFAYSAGRLPDCMPRIRHIVLGQSPDQFHRAGYAVDRWTVVRTRGRRRPLRWDGGSTLAAFIASASDIDDLVPILTAYQIEWNKLRTQLLGARIADVSDDRALAAALGDDAAVARLRGALGPRSDD